MILEAEFSPGMPLRDCVEVARLVEDAGFDRLGISDVVLWQDTYVVQALCARATSRVEVGAMVTNAYLRHPAVTAAAVAGIAELSGGRAFLGLGVGAGLDAVGVDVERPVVTLREAILVVRALLAGETVRRGGSVFRLEQAALRVPPEVSVPIAVGTRSPAVARLAGELADRALVGARYLSPAFADAYRSWVAEGARRAGRDPRAVEIAPRLTLCCSADRDAAYATMRRDAAEFLVTLRPHDLEIEPERLEAIERAWSTRRGWYFDPDAHHPPELDELVDDRLVQAFSICGTAEEVATQLRGVVAMGFSAASLKLAPVRRRGWSMFEGLRETVVTAADALRSLGAGEPGDGPKRDEGRDHPAG